MANKGAGGGVEVEGASQLRRAFKKMGDRAGDLKTLHGDVASIVEERAVELVPYLSGRLQESIRSSSRKTGSSVDAGRGLEPYAGPIHFGWRARNIEPQPFLYDALDDRREEVRAKYAAGIGDLVRRFDTEAPD